MGNNSKKEVGNRIMYTKSGQGYVLCIEVGILTRSGQYWQEEGGVAGEKVGSLQGKSFALSPKGGQC